jgi:hypothetical protein
MRSSLFKPERIFGRHRTLLLHLTFFASFIGSIFGWCFLDYFGGMKIVLLMAVAIFTGLYEIDHLSAPP